MKKINFKFVVLGVTLIVGLLLTYSCSKDRIAQPTLNAYNSPNSYLDSKQQAEQEFTIDSAGTGPIVGNQGTKIWTGKQCLMMPNGDTVIYPFKVKLVELYTAKDMIYYRMPTVAGGNILETDGEIRLRAFKGATELLLKPGGCYAQIEMPNAAPKNYMRVFYGYNPSASFVDFSDNPTTVGAATTSLNPLFTATSYGYLGQIGKLGWINCGANAANTSSSVLTFTSTVDDLTNVAIFAYIPATKTVIQAYNLSTCQIPNGAAVKIVAIAVDASNQLFYFNQNLTVSSSQQISVTMSSTTDASLTALLNGL
jgi:hypothetical protein